MRCDHHGLHHTADLVFQGSGDGQVEALIRLDHIPGALAALDRLHHDGRIVRRARRRRIVGAGLEHRLVVRDEHVVGVQDFLERTGQVEERPRSSFRILGDEGRVLRGCLGAARQLAVLGVNEAPGDRAGVLQALEERLVGVARGLGRNERERATQHHDHHQSRGHEDLEREPETASPASTAHASPQSRTPGRTCSCARRPGTRSRPARRPVP